jgi:hypothetical protein
VLYEQGLSKVLSTKNGRFSRRVKWGKSRLMRPNKSAHYPHEPGDWSAEHLLGLLESPSVRAGQVRGAPVHGKEATTTEVQVGQLL